jgi:hypothetical protein
MLKQNQFDSDPARECARDFDPCAPQLTCRRILHVLRREYPKAQLAGPDDIGDPWVRRWFALARLTRSPAGSTE